MLSLAVGCIALIRLTYYTTSSHGIFNRLTPAI